MVGSEPQEQIHNPLGDFIKQQRTLKGWSQRDLAKASGVSNGYIGNLERGFDFTTGKAVKPSVDKLSAIAKGLGVDPDVLSRLARGLPLANVLASIEYAQAEKRIDREHKSIVAEVVAAYNQAKGDIKTFEAAYSWLRKRSVQAVHARIDLPHVSLSDENDYKWVAHVADPIFSAVLDKVETPEQSMYDHDGVTDEDLAELDRQLGFGPLPTNPKVPADATEPPDEWELGVLEKIGQLDFGMLDPRRDDLFWYEPKEARRRILRNLEDLWYEHQNRQQKRG